MKVLVVAAHPNFEKSKVNKRWIEELKKYDEITISNYIDWSELFK
jgi:putative NADPH-quinone reductase